jgi:hypothetical protein
VLFRRIQYAFESPGIVTIGHVKFESAEVVMLYSDP